MRTAFVSTLLAIFLAGMSYYAHSQNSDKNYSQTWVYDDVRIIDPIDSTNAESDIVAVLSKHDSETLKIRIDFLDLHPDYSFNLDVFLDNKPGGISIHNQLGFEWDYLIQYTTSGSLKIVSDKDEEIYDTKLRMYRDINGKFLELTAGTGTHIENLSSARIIISTNLSEYTQIIDQTDVFFLAGSPPPAVDISFLFWNVMTSSTPATILRSWAGAHTGPQSSRHGLLYLLNSVRDWNIPITICGLFNRDSKFSLEYIKAWPKITGMIHDGLLYPLEYCDIDIYSEQRSSDFMLNPQLDNTSVFVSDIVDHYFSENNSQVILGGDFTHSPLGSPEINMIFFSYINSHPWIRVVNPYGVAHLVYTVNETLVMDIQDDSEVPYSISGMPIPSGLTVSEIQNLAAAELANLPQNRISTLARQLYKTILDSQHANIINARGSYLSQLGHLGQAARWAENPGEISTCQQDIDWDGQPECILSSINTFMTIELDGGYLAFLFTINNSGIHQLIGPTSQFDILRSDPSELNPERGIAGDPGQIIGAYADPISSIQEYHIGRVEQFLIELISQDLYTRKVFSILDQTIHVAIIENNARSITVRKLPLVLDPWRVSEHFSPEMYWNIMNQTQWVWGLGDSVSIGISSSSEYEWITFNATYGALQNPEDPNYNYTPGHLLPIPMALVEFQPESTLIIDLIIDP